jgi:hypothetical protein
MAAYDFQLLLEHGVAWAPDQEIIYRDQVRHTYTDMYDRVLRLGAALQRLGVKEGAKVGIIEWDSHRYSRYGENARGNCCTGTVRDGQEGLGAFAELRAVAQARTISDFSKQGRCGLRWRLTADRHEKSSEFPTQEGQNGG